MNFRPYTKVRTNLSMSTGCLVLIHETQIQTRIFKISPEFQGSWLSSNSDAIECQKNDVYIDFFNFEFFIEKKKKTMEKRFWSQRPTKTWDITRRFERSLCHASNLRKPGRYWKSPRDWSTKDIEKCHQCILYGSSVLQSGIFYGVLLYLWKIPKRAR